MITLLLFLGAAESLTRKRTSHPTPIPKDMADDLPFSDAFIPCIPGDLEYNAQLCVDAVWDYERRIRVNLEDDLGSITSAAANAPLYDAIIQNITKTITSLEYELGLSSTSDAKSVQNIISDAQVALFVIEANTGLVPALQNISTQVLGNLGTLPETMGNYTNDMIVNVTNDLSFLLANQTLLTNSEISAVSQAFSTAKKNITDYHTASLQSAKATLKALNAVIEDWKTYQDGNLSMAASRLVDINSDLQTISGKLKANLAEIASNMSVAAVETLSKNTANQTHALQRAVNNITSLLNDTYNVAVKQLQVADAAAYANRQEFRVNNAKQLNAFQSQLDNIFTSVANFSAVEGVSLNDFVASALRNRQSNFSALNMSLTDAASAAVTFQGLANSSAVAGLLYTRKVLAALNDMLRSVKQAVAKQTSSFAAATGKALVSQAGGVANSSASGQSAANSAKAAVGGQAAEVTGTAGKNLDSMVGSMAELLDAISGMSDVMKAKVGLFSDSSAGSLTSVDDTITDAVGSISSTLADISEANREKAASSAAALLGLEANSRDQAASALSDFQASLASNLDEMGEVYAGARSKGQAVLSDASNAATASSAAVGGVQGTSGQLSNAARDAVAGVSAGFGQLGNIVGNTETAARQAVAQAQQSMMDFVGGRGSKAAEAMTMYAGDTNQTFKSGFMSIQKSVTATQMRESAEFQDLKAGGGKMKDGMISAIEDYNQLVNSTLSQNSSLAKLMDTMGSTAKARWDSIVLSRMNGFEAIMSDMNDAYDQFSTIQIGSMQDQSQMQLSDIATRMRMIINEMVGMTGGANLTLLSLASASSSLNSTSMNVDASAANASSDLASLNAAQDAHFDVLTNKSADVDAFLVASAAAMNQQVIGQNSTVAEMMLNVTNNASTQVETDASSFVNFTNSFIASISKLDAAQTAFVDDQSTQRVSLINQVQTDIASLRDDLVSAVLAGNSKNGDLASELNAILAEIASSQQLLGNEQGSNLAGIQTKLKSLSNLVSGLGGSLQQNLDSAMKRIATEAQIQAVQSGDSQTATVSNQTSRASGLGNQVLNLLDGVISAGNAGDIDLNDQQVAAMQMAQMIQSLGTNGSQALRNLLSAIQSGKITVQQALASASTLNEASLDSVGGIAGSLQAVVQGYVSGTQLFFGNASSQVTTYNDSAQAYVKNMGVLQDAAAANVVGLASIVKLLTDSYVADMGGLIPEETEVLNEDQQTVSRDSVFAK